MLQNVKAPANVVKAAATGKVGVLRAWLSSDVADVNAANAAGDTLLHIAAGNGHERVAELLLRGGADIYQQNSDGATALMHAALAGHERVVESLLQCGAEVSQHDGTGVTALMGAAFNGHERVVELLLRRRAEIDQQDSNGVTALVIAASNGHERVVDLLLQRGADANLQNSYGWTALMRAAGQGHHATVRLLLRGGADTKLCSELGKSALQMAKEEGHAECVEAFRQHIAEVTAGQREAAAGGASSVEAAAGTGAAACSDSLGSLPNEAVAAALNGDEAALLAWLDSGGRVNATCQAGDVSGVTALMIAARSGHERVVELLLQRGTDANKQRSDGGTALMHAAADGHERVVELLLPRGAEINTQDCNGNTALMAAASQGHERVVELLLRRGADANLQKSDGGTALMLAAIQGHERVVELLLQRGAEINKQNSYGGTALMVAAVKGHPATVLRLLRAGADTKLRTEDGKSALQYAREQGHSECVEAFRQHIAEVTAGRREAAAGSAGGASAVEAAAGARVATSSGSLGSLPEEAVEVTFDGDEAALLAWLESGGRVNATCRAAGLSGVTALMLAAGSGHERVVELLLQRGAEVNLQKSDGGTVLMLAAQEGHERMVELLLQRGADANLQNSVGNTALMLAAGFGHTATVLRLLRAGADTTACSASGRTALQLAEERGHSECVRALEEHVASQSAAKEAAQAAAREVESAAAEAEAARHAEALLAEEEAEKEAGRAKASKKGKKKKEKGGGGEAVVSAPGPSGTAASAPTHPPPAAPPLPADAAAIAAADEALQQAVTAGVYEGVASALEACSGVASPAVLAAAKRARDKLMEARRRDSQRLRKAHGAAMGALKSLDTADSPSALREGIAAAKAHVGVMPALSEEVSAAESKLEELSVAAEMSSTAAPPIEVNLSDLAAATDGFADGKLIGSGGFSRVYEASDDLHLSLSAPPQLRHLPLVVKRAKSGQSGGLSRAELEVKLLKAVSHPHLLPLLGYCLSADGICLLSPLMRGGSLEARLRISDPDRAAQLRRLGMAEAPRPLTWQQRVRIACEAIEALVYLHSKGIVHRDVKPDNILLDEKLTAVLADTGFAKDQRPGASVRCRSTALYMSTGYLCPSISKGGEYSPKTDGYAVGITLLVCLTNRSEVQLTDRCEEEFDELWTNIDASQIADAAARWTATAARAVKDLAQAGDGQKSLCHNSLRNRCTLPGALTTLRALLSSGAGAEEAAPALGDEAATAAVSTTGYEPSLLSVQVRGMRTGGDAQARIEGNMLLAFNTLMPRLDSVYASRAAAAPDGFEERINFWHRECGLPTELRSQLHSLRIWANAARHHDAARWRRDGPRSEGEASRLVAAVTEAIGALEAG